MLRILLIGVAHEYQWECDKTFGFAIQSGKLSLFRSQRALYREWIRKQVRDFSPDLIFDEMNSVYGESDDRLEDTGVSWVYMDIPEQVRKKFGLSIARNSHGREWVREVDEPREIYWQMVIEGISSACKVQTVLAICGLAHLGSFASRLALSGHAVSVKNVRDEFWNDESWRPIFTGMHP
jgi:hypothetical protein